MYFIINKNIDIVGEITTYSSINWEEEYLSQTGGDFEITLPASDYYYLHIQEGFIIYKTDSKKFGLVNYIEYIDNFTEDEKVEQLIKIKGEMGESILKRRVISPQLNKSGTIDDIFKSVIDTHFTNPKDAKRKINLEYIPNVKYSNKVSKSITGCTVAELFESVCSSKEYSYNLYLDLENKKFYCKLINGNDKSDSVIFSKEDDNLSNFKYVRSQEKLKTHIIVAGEGDGDNRTMVTVSNLNCTGLNRIESYLDKDNMSSKDLTDESYKNKLIEEGKTELNKYSTSEGTEFDILLNNYVVGTDFDLGDKVKIINENLGIETTTRVLAILYNSDENGIETIQVTLGNISEIDLEEDETNSKDNENESDTTNDSKTNSINTEYIKINAIDEEGNTLSDLEFAGGFFKIADKVFVMSLKNNTNKIINKISYECETNLLLSENIINVSSIEKIYCYSTHTVKDNIHTYDCYLSYYSNLTKIITVGEQYKEDEIPEEKFLHFAGDIETFLCEGLKNINGTLSIQGGEKKNYGSYMTCEYKIENNYENINIRNHTKELDYYSTDSTTYMIEYNGYLTALDDTYYNSLLSFIEETITYNISCEYDVYYKIIDKDKNVSKIKKANGTISCKNGEIIKVYIYTVSVDTLPDGERCTVSLNTSKHLQFNSQYIDSSNIDYAYEPLVCSNGIYIKVPQDLGTNYKNYQVKNVDKINFEMNCGYMQTNINTVYIINTCDTTECENIIANSAGIEQVEGVINLYPKLDESTS